MSRDSVTPNRINLAPFSISRLRAHLAKTPLARIGGAWERVIWHKRKSLPDLWILIELHLEKDRLVFDQYGRATVQVRLYENPDITDEERLTGEGKYSFVAYIETDNPSYKASYRLHKPMQQD